MSTSGLNFSLPSCTRGIISVRPRRDAVDSTLGALAMLGALVLLSTLVLLGVPTSTARRAT